MYHKWESYDVWFLRYGMWQTEYFVILCHFCPFTPLLAPKIKIWKKCKKSHRYYPFKHVYHKWRSYDVWFLRYKARRTEFFVNLGHFLSFDPPNNLKILKKLKKTCRDIIILHLCTTNENHMMYGSWNLECDRQNFLSFWTIFYPFTLPLPTSPLTTQKIKTLTKWKK